ARRENERTEDKFVAVLHRLARKPVLGAALAAGINLRGARAVGQLARTAHEIGVDVRFENVRDRDAALSRQLEVNLNIRAWVDDCGGALFIIADQVGDCGDAIGENAFKDERHRIEQGSGIYRRTSGDYIMRQCGDCLSKSWREKTIATSAD